MRLKPRSTVRNQRALLYKRFTSIEISKNISTLYRTGDGKYWTFDVEQLNFVQYTGEIPENYTKIDVFGYPPFLANTTVFKYEKYYFYYSSPLFGTAEWVRSEDITSLGDITLLSAKFNNVAKYQVNKYYFVGSFDYVIKGSIEGTTAQYIKGNIIPLSSLNIKHYNDDIRLSPDDLVVVDGHLYSVESPETVIKQQPKPFKIYFATLNNIL